VQPRGVALAPDGMVYVADAGRKAVVVLPPDGGEARVLAEGQFRELSGVAVLPDRSLVVIDAGAGAAWRLSPDGVLGERLVQEPMYAPRGIAAGRDGRIVIADTGNNRLLVVPPSGGAPQIIGGFKEPTDAAFLPDGNLLVADTGAKEFVVVKPDGSRVSSWPMPNAFTVVGPHVAVLPGGGWVATAPEDRSLLYMAPNGRSPQKWTPPAEFRKPVGIAAGRSGVVVVDVDAASAVLLSLP
jgi:DNA-binding beta-propeller fold protein YncE